MSPASFPIFRLLAGNCLPRVACLACAAPVLAVCGETPRPDGRSPHSALPVRVEASGMVRDGKPYFVKGAGGSGSLAKLAARGGNSIRTWDTHGLDATLDHAGKLGLTVSAGIWLEPESGWFSYRNPAHCDKQAERVRKQVVLHRDHPALLAWGLGNEVEGDGTNADYWRQLDRLAKMVKELDPAHPTFTAVAGVNQAKVDGLMQHTPHCLGLEIRGHRHLVRGFHPPRGKHGRRRRASGNVVRCQARQPGARHQEAQWCSQVIPDGRWRL